MKRATFRQGLVLAAVLALGVSGAIADEPQKSESAQAKSAEPEASATTATTAAAAEAEDPFVIPPGFVKKKRGKHILYCKRDASMGTRIRTEKCYDERGMRDYLLALKEEKNNIDRIRATCSNVCTCGQDC